MGDHDFVYDVKKSQKRANAAILTTKEGLKWKLMLDKDHLTVGRFLNYLMTLKLKDYSQVFYSGDHFCREVFTYFQR